MWSELHCGKISPTSWRMSSYVKDRKRTNGVYGSKLFLDRCLSKLQWEYKGVNYIGGGSESTFLQETFSLSFLRRVGVASWKKNRRWVIKAEIPGKMGKVGKSTLKITVITNYGFMTKASSLSRQRSANSKSHLLCVLSNSSLKALNNRNLEWFWTVNVTVEFCTIYKEDVPQWCFGWMWEEMYSILCII